MSEVIGDAARGFAPRGTVALTVSLALVGLGLVAAGGGDIALAFMPVALVVIVYAGWKTPTRTMVFGLFAAGLTLDPVAERPASGLWHSPLYPLGAFLYDNLNNVVHVSALRFSGLDFAIVVLLLVVVVRSARRGSTVVPDKQMANALVLCLAVQLAAVIWLELWGLSRGGDFKSSLWQVRPLLWLPVLAALLMHVLRGPRDALIVVRFVVVAACIKTAIGLYFLFFVARPGHLPYAYVTTHSDSVLFCSAIAACVATMVHWLTPRVVACNGAAAIWILLGVVANDRRIAYVGLVAALVVIYLVIPRGGAKRAVTRGMLMLLPLSGPYLLIGHHSGNPVFAPAAKIWSVIEQKDASSETRDIENYNLILTLKPHPLLGTGFGHEYLEFSKGDDISKFFALYRYIGHNSVLWLWSVAGLAGFTAIWMTVVVTVFLARRAYAYARTPNEHIIAVWALGVVAIYLVQVWGDMGMNGWVVDFVLAAAIAVTGKLAVVTGAWPSGARLLRTTVRPVAPPHRAPHGATSAATA